MRPHADGAGARAFEYYVLKTYYKTGSLMANSCRAAALLGGHGPAAQAGAHEYGKRVGLAFQLMVFTPHRNNAESDTVTAIELLIPQHFQLLFDYILRSR
jgi:Polyprenyl synthetase